MSSSSVDVVTTILSAATEIERVRPLVSDNFTYVSLNYNDPDLKRIMPWCGAGYGVEALVSTFVDVGRFWRVDDFSVETAFGQDENFAVFGRFTYTSTVLSRTVTSPFAVFAKVSDGKCFYMQFMEDTFATAASFRSGGTWFFRSDPAGDEITI